MFSIEATIDELIKFVKKFFATLSNTFLFPRRLLTNAYSGALLKPSHYLLICMLIFFSMQSLNSWYIHAISLNKTFKTYLSNYESNAIESNLLYIIPIAIGIWGLVTLAGKILRLNDASLNKFKAYLFCWLGNCLLLNTLYIAVTVIRPNMVITVNSEPDSSFFIINKIIEYAYYLCWFGPIVLSVGVVCFIYKKLTRALWLKFLMIPVILWISVNFCLRGAKVISGFLEEKEELLQFYSRDGNNHSFFMYGVKDDPKIDSLRLEITTVIRNNSPAEVYFSDDNPLYLYAGEEPGSSGEPTTATLMTKQIDGELPKSITFLKANESKAFLFSGKVSTHDWSIWLKKAGVTTGGWCKANYGLDISSPDLHGVGASGQLMVDYKTNNPPAQKPKK